MSSPMSSVQSIRRAFAVLGALADGPLGVTRGRGARPRIPKSHGRPPARRARGRGRRRAGPRRAALPARARTSSALASGLGDDPRAGRHRPPDARRAGRASSGEAAGLSVRDGWTVHYVDQVDSPNPVQVRDWTGTRIPLHAVSSGQVFLAQLPAPALVALPRRAAGGVHGAHPHRAARSSSGSAHVRRDGHAWVRDEFADRDQSVAAPIADARGEVVAAVHVHGPSYRFPTPGSEAKVASAVVAAAAEVGMRLRA